MWRCCICLDWEFTEVREYATHVALWHPEWLEGRRVPPRAMRPLWLVELEEERVGWRR